MPAPLSVAADTAPLARDGRGAATSVERSGNCTAARRGRHLWSEVGTVRRRDAGDIFGSVAELAMSG